MKLQELYEDQMDEGWKSKLAGAAMAGAVAATVLNSPPTFIKGDRYELAVDAPPKDAKLVTTDDGKKVYTWTAPALRKTRSPTKLYAPINEGRFDEPLQGLYVVSKSNDLVVSKSFDSKEAAQKHLMTKMFANHHLYTVQHFE